jgi:proton glutamate symport protein
MATHRLDPSARRGLALHWKILIGLTLGIVVGLLINAQSARLEQLAADNATLAGIFGFLASLTTFVGAMFVRLLRFIAIPIVLFSLIVGAASLGDLRKLGRIGLRTVGVYLLTTSVAVVVGLTLANVVRPGRFITPETRDQLAERGAANVPDMQRVETEIPGVWKQLENLVPENPFRAVADGTMLQVIVFALAIGIGLTMIPRAKAAPVIAFFDAMTDVVVKLVHMIMVLAPYAVFALLVPVVAVMGPEVLTALGAYSLSVLGGLAVLLLLVYPLLLKFVAGVNPPRFFRAMAPAQLLAFSSSSSSATLPVTLDCAINRLGVPEPVASFVCPLGATINMDGTALYQAIAAMFIAQMYGIELSLSQQVIILLTAVLASIGTPGIPGAGVLMLIIVLESVGIPPATIAGGIAIVLGVDRLLDMCRTVINVSGDGMTAAIIARTEDGLQTLKPDPVESGG